jgi:hypothetical protein
MTTRRPYRSKVHPYRQAEARHGCHRVAEPGRNNHILRAGSHKVDILAVDRRGSHSPAVIAVAAIVLSLSHPAHPTSANWLYDWHKLIYLFYVSN